ncbi:Hypothetical protein PENO1_094590 [Penicillium occitanis (nom. inval.)]|nr:Hypothetical protein PENO1_094590 [Penicillium occitanis (nom. inval.)]PCG91669.1 hypothetical protein PENOC_096310 [Penicillium occitanis (nom. inval.)]
MTGFFDLPLEVRHMIYMNLISTEMPLDPKEMPLGFWHPFPSKCLHVDLFYTSGRISLEYRTLVYSKIAFDLRTHSPAHTARFLDQIGENAKDIRHVHIRFPKVLENGDGLFILDRSAQILDKVQSACTSLTKATFGPVCAFDGRVSPYLESPEKTSNLFRLVNERLQALRSLWSITVAIPASNAYRHISDELKNRYGWNVIEEEDWSQFVSGILAGIGAGNRPRLRNTDDGEMDGGSSGSSHDTKVDGYDRNTGGDGLHIDGSDEGKNVVVLEPCVILENGDTDDDFYGLSEDGGADNYHYHMRYQDIDDGDADEKGEDEDALTWQHTLYSGLTTQMNQFIGIKKLRQEQTNR